MLRGPVRAATMRAQPETVSLACVRDDEIARIRERFERLLAAGVAIFSRHELGDVLQEIVEAARAVVGARYAALGVLGPDHTTLVQFVTAGMDEETRRRIGDLPRGRGLLGHVIREGRPVRTADITHHAQRSGFPGHHPPMKSFLGVPVQGRGGVFGNLYLTEKIGSAEFDDEDEAIAVLLASQAAVAVENARLLEQIRGMQRQRDLFFAMMNHELRNALTGVYGWAERLVQGRSSQDTAHAAQEVYESAEHTIAVLNNFLDLMRLEAGKVRPVWRDMALATCVERAVGKVQPAADQKQVRLTVRHEGVLPELRTDPVRLEQILSNLLANAVRHTAQRGSVEVVTASDALGVRVAVLDHGAGIAPELRSRIFEPFERFDPHSGIGTGLGLPISRRLAAALGGTLGIEDTPGGGATFVLRLPVQPTDT